MKMTSTPEVLLADVLLHDQAIGVLDLRGEQARFAFQESYIQDANRAVLGLQFEEDLHASHKSNVRLPPWFSNLLPEGKLRELIANHCGVSIKREARLLLALGHDLPGAITVQEKPAEAALEAKPDTAKAKRERSFASAQGVDNRLWRFSLAGVALKFSLLKMAERFTLPAADPLGGDWIVKLPDSQYPEVPENEFGIMSLASAVGIDVPPIELVAREQLPDLPDHFWPNQSRQAFAIKRFDRGLGRIPIHMEDFAQVRGKWPQEKYESSFETVASLCFRKHDTHSLIEFTKRMIFNILIGNGDAHLKNWTLLYADRKKPRLSPAYDLVSTIPYIASDDIGLKWRGKKHFSAINLAGFDALANKLGARDAALADVARETVAQVGRVWAERSETLIQNLDTRRAISTHLSGQMNRLLLLNR
jgi:serine/threonine-protein kinase HipA